MGSGSIKTPLLFHCKTKFDAGQTKQPVIEKLSLQAKISEGKKKLADEIQLVNSARQWTAAIQEYADIAELDAAVLNKLVKEIVVHEEIDSDKTRHIFIEIHFNLKPIPEVEQVRK